MYTAYLQGSLKLAATGEWRHNGEPFQNQKLSELFSRSIVWDQSAGQYFVQIGQQRAAFDCEDTAYFVLSIDDKEVPWSLHLSDGRTEALRPTTLCSGPENQVYCTVHETHRARLSRPAHQILLQHAVSDDSILIGGAEYRLRLERREAPELRLVKE